MSISGHKYSGKALERSNSVQTYTLLSKYLKEKRSTLGDLSPSPAPTTTMNLLRNLENSTPTFNSEADQQQMTVFYGGKMLVFNGIPADKAKGIMDLVCGGGTVKDTASSVGKNVIPDLNLAPIVEPRAKIMDMPIARRASLYRFLEKRKDRAASTAPYQLNNSTQIESRIFSL